MKIENVETILCGPYCLVVIVTDNGTTGVGESAYWGNPAAAAEAVKAFAPYLLGKDPLQREHHWGALYRAASFRGAAVSGALSALDIALWDIAGKHFQAPIYQMLGGECRSKIRMCGLIWPQTVPDDVEHLVKIAKEQVATGHTVLKFIPFPPNHQDYSLPRFLKESIARVEAVRSAVGSEVDLIIECHRDLGPEQAIALVDAVRSFALLFVEDPIQPDNLGEMGRLAARLALPVGTGERLHTVYEFADLLEAGPIAHFKPDIGLAGGFTHCRKIAALAEAHHIQFTPHNFLSPVLLAAHAQFGAATPNFPFLEYAPHSSSVLDLFRTSPTVTNGFLQVSQGPGLGIELNLEAARALASEPIQRKTHIRADGSAAYR